MTSRVVLFVLVFFGSMLQSFARVTNASSAGPALTLVSTPSQGLIRVELHNPGTQDLVLNLGVELANGVKQYPNAVDYTLTSPDNRILHLRPIKPAYIAGRADPMIVPLPSGATFSFLVNLQKCFAPTEKVWKLHLAPGRYTLRAEYTGRIVTNPNLDMKGLALMPVWTGTVHSPSFSFTVR